MYYFFFLRDSEMRFLFLFISEFFCEEVEIPDNESGCDTLHYQQAPMCPNEFGVCPFGSTFHTEAPINRTDICNYGPVITERREVNGTCVCDQHEMSRVPGYGYVFGDGLIKSCIHYSQCCANHNADLKIVEEMGQKRYKCVCKEGFEESESRDITGSMIRSCARKCPDNEEFTSCVATQVHCTLQPTPRICLHGCRCKSGFKRAGEHCIKSEDCPVCGDGARYNNPPNGFLRKSITLGPVYVPLKDKYGGLCQCGWSKVMMPGGNCYDEEDICTKFGGLYDNSKILTSRICDGESVTLMNGKCSCPRGYVVYGSSDTISII